MQQVHSAGDLIAQPRQGMVLLLLLAPACGDLALPGGLIGGTADLERGLVALLELLANLMKGQKLPPAGLDGAGARDTVAFAGGLHSGFDCLRPRQRNTVKHCKTLKA